MRPWTWRQAIIKSTLPATTRHVLLTLSVHINDAGESAYPSIDLLAVETALSRRAVITHLQTAAALGWIRTTKHGFGDRRWARNEYDPCIPDDFVPVEMDKARPLRGGEPDDNEAVNDVHDPKDKAVNVVPRGGEPDDNEAVNDVHDPKDKAVNVVPRGGEPDDNEAVNDVHSNIPLEHSKEHSIKPPREKAARRVGASKKSEAKKSLLPDSFSVSDRVRHWAAEKDHARLDERLEHFVGTARAKGYRYVDWDQAFMNAIREDWAKLGNSSAPGAQQGTRRLAF